MVHFEAILLEGLLQESDFSVATETVKIFQKLMWQELCRVLMSAEWMLTQHIVEHVLSPSLAFLRLFLFSSPFPS